MAGENDMSDASVSWASPRRKQFRNRFAAVRLTPDAVERQSRITLLAWDLMGPDAALAFLNNHDADLNGRPLDLAVASGAGYAAVEREIAARGQRT